MALQYCKSNVAFFQHKKIKFPICFIYSKNANQKLLDAIFLLVALIIKIPGHSNLDSIKARKITLLVLPQGMLPLKEPTAI